MMKEYASLNSTRCTSQGGMQIKGPLGREVLRFASGPRKYLSNGHMVMLFTSEGPSFGRTVWS